ncbi:MAG: AEC family transporter [Liquorilactobacillus hordei]|uniref:AEC family transporter n=1 Tax=Lactobacillaceae TaxID=33958 RepID=UPI0039EA1D3C
MNTGVLFNQIFLMFCLMLLGLLANKIKFIHEQTANDLTNILLYLVSPCLIIKSFEIHYSAQRLDQLLLIASSMLIIYSLQILCSKLIFHAVTDPRLQRITKFGSIYSNAGFIGIPLVSSLFGDRGVFYAVVPIVFFNLFNWTHGVALFNKEESKIGIKQEFFRVIFNPNIIAILLRGLIFASSLQLPGILKQLINDISAINTPLSMLVIGNSFANITLKDCRLSWALVAAVFLRNLIYPLLTVVVISFLGITGMAQAAVVLMMACPVAGIVVLFTLQQHEDPSPAVTLMSLSTLLSVITIPLVFIISREFF